MKLGQWEMALLETEESLRLDENSSVAEGNLAWIQLALGRTEDARAAYAQALAKLDIAAPQRRLVELKLIQVGGSPARPEARG